VIRLSHESIAANRIPAEPMPPILQDRPPQYPPFASERLIGLELALSSMSLHVQRLATLIISGSVTKKEG
jgi:hypothetical protein